MVDRLAWLPRRQWIPSPDDRLVASTFVESSRPEGKRERAARRLRRIADLSAHSLASFVQEAVAAGSVVHTDGQRDWSESGAA